MNSSQPSTLPKGQGAKLKIALVGCGKAADLHVSEIGKLLSVQLVAVCDSEPLMAEQLAVRYGIAKPYSDFDAMLSAERPDVVHITTPPNSHLSLAIQALDAGCHVMVEKPLALDAAQAGQLLAHATKCERKLTVGYTYYFDPIVQKLRSFVQEGVMGEAVHLESFFGYNLKGPFGTPIFADSEHWVHKLPGGLLQNVLDHLLNKIIEFVPDENPSVSVRSWQGSRDLPHIDYELLDELRVMVAGEKVSANAVFSSHARPVRHALVFHGTRNTAHLDFISGTITLQPNSSLPGVLGRLANPFQQSWQHFRQGGKNIWRFARSDYQSFAGFQALIAAFYQSILQDTPPPIAYREILRVSTLMDEVTQKLHRVEVAER